LAPAIAIGAELALLIVTKLSAAGVVGTTSSGQSPTWSRRSSLEPGSPSTARLSGGSETNVHGASAFVHVERRAAVEQHEPVGDRLISPRPHRRGVQR
jgi:hypothetical protein